MTIAALSLDCLIRRMPSEPSECCHAADEKPTKARVFRHLGIVPLMSGCRGSRAQIGTKRRLCGFAGGRSLHISHTPPHKTRAGTAAGTSAMSSKTSSRPGHEAVPLRSAQMTDKATRSQAGWVIRVHTLSRHDRFEAARKHAGGSKDDILDRSDHFRRTRSRQSD